MTLIVKMNKRKKKKKNEDPDRQWVVQFFRSITPDSALTDGIENSIHRGYINAIQNAQRFIYVENQYFMGSVWNGNQGDKPGHNRIPFEIASKIVERISRGKDFQVYVVMPMFPEGDPNSSAVQEMLDWQWNTMEKMYHIIAEAIKEKKT